MLPQPGPKKCKTHNSLVRLLGKPKPWLGFDLINPSPRSSSSLPLLCTKMLCRGSLPAHQGKAPTRRKQHLHYHLARNFQSLIFQYVFLSRLMGHYTKVLTFLSKNIVFTKKLLICKKVHLVSEKVTWSTKVVPIWRAELAWGGLGLFQNVDVGWI